VTICTIEAVFTDQWRGPVIDLNPASQLMIEVLAGVNGDLLSGPSPCAEYTVGDLIDHVDQVCRGSAALARQDVEALGGTNAAPDGAHLGPDWRDRVAEHLRAVGKAWENPSAWEGSGNVPGSDLSNEVWGTITLTELVVHGWDSAMATGQSFALPEPTLHACLDHVSKFVPNAPIPGPWGPPVDVGPDATLLDQVVAITGRTP
jgi:uncharacterized protein (TIGR03086 family)